MKLLVAVEDLELLVQGHRRSLEAVEVCNIRAGDMLQLQPPFSTSLRCPCLAIVMHSGPVDELFHELQMLYPEGDIDTHHFQLNCVFLRIVKSLVDIETGI